MGSLENQFTELYIHDSVWNSEVAKRTRSLLKVSAIRVDSKPYADQRSQLSGDEFTKSKKRLYLAPHLGQFFRKCPGTQGAACCNYFVLNLGVQCNMNCSYCYLQSYINSPLSQIYTNIEEALFELEGKAREFPNAPFRVGTGETIDSLSLDDLTLYSAVVVRWFQNFPKLTCEFKTKSANIKNFINLPHSGNVVVSFSVNPEKIVEAEEHETARLWQRLKAARDAADAGFPVAFHFDPMIYVSGWQKLYSELVHLICSLFEPLEVKWISVGALRFPPQMKHILRERFGGDSIGNSSELFLGKDGKLRYDLGLRTKMFTHVKDEFLEHGKKFPVFLCMETPESWLGTFQNTPRKVKGLDELFVAMPS